MNTRTRDYWLNIFWIEFFIGGLLYGITFGPRVETLLMIIILGIAVTIICIAYILTWDKRQNG
ncbi:hypothetical protein LCGC14_2290510 [marine sediment metagenome]|uniref:Uncharacterized protein n=1 Tax=marine sediment metagenome TaxID=412755 RepID=A0A0F9FLM3_9ZZZZ